MRVPGSYGEAGGILWRPSPPYFKCAGWVNAPLPAESHTANRTHFLPVASNGTRNLWLPNGAISFMLINCRSTLSPSLQTSSANSGGKVHSTSAAYARFAPAKATRYREGLLPDW